MSVADLLARAMFDRRCSLDGGDPALVEGAWADRDVRAFWQAEADHVLATLARIGAR